MCSVSNKTMSSKSSIVDDFESWERLSNLSSAPSSNSINFVQLSINSDHLMNDFDDLNDFQFDRNESSNFDVQLKFMPENVDDLAVSETISKRSKSVQSDIKLTTKRSVRAEDWRGSPQLILVDNWDFDTDKEDDFFDDDKQIVPKSFWSKIQFFSITNVISFLIGCGLGVWLNRHGIPARLFKFV